MTETVDTVEFPQHPLSQLENGSFIMIKKKLFIKLGQSIYPVTIIDKDRDEIELGKQILIGTIPTEGLEVHLLSADERKECIDANKKSLRKRLSDTVS